MGPKGEPDTKTNWSTDSQPQDKPTNCWAYIEKIQQAFQRQRAPRAFTQMPSARASPTHSGSAASQLTTRQLLAQYCSCLSSSRGRTFASLNGFLCSNALVIKPSLFKPYRNIRVVDPT
jgi:hypothetical protein